MINSFKSYGLPVAVGVNFLYSNRNSRSLAVGCHEQRFLCTLDWIGRIEIFKYLSTANIQALCSERFAKHFSYLGSYSYVIVPLLHYASYSLEKSSRIRTKKVADFMYTRIPDFILVAGIVQSTAALYFGVYTAPNTIALTFYLMGFLEQGLFWEKPVENRGLLFKFRNGQLIRLYDRILGKVHNWTCLPFSFYYGGLAGKVKTAFFAFLMLPQSIQTYFIPQKMKKISAEVTQQLEEELRNIDVPCHPVPQKVQRIWHDRKNRFEMTQKHFELFEITDQFPSCSLEQLEKKLQQQLERDQAMSKEDKSQLGELIGSGKKHGSLYAHMQSATDTQEQEESVIYLKNIFGAIDEDWEGRKSYLLSRHGDFLCKPAIGDTIKKLCLELYSEIQKSDSQPDPDALLANRIEKSIALVLQQHRDMLFMLIFQTLAAKMKELKEQVSDAKNEKRRTLFQTSSKIRECFSARWWSNFYGYCRSSVADLLMKLDVFILDQASTNRHEINTYKVLFGKNLGFSGYEDAVRDFESAAAASSIPKSFLTDRSALTARYFEPLFRSVYARSWQEVVIGAIVNLGDERIKIGDIQHYLSNRAFEGGEEKGQEVWEDIEKVKIPTRLDLPEAYDKYFKEVKPFLAKYLDLILHDFGYSMLHQVM